MRAWRGWWAGSTSGTATSPGSPPSLHVSQASGSCTPSSTLKRPSIGLLNAFISRRQGTSTLDRVHPGPAFQRDVLDAAERRPSCLDMDQALVVPIHPHVDVPDHSCTVGSAGTATDRCRWTCPRLGITPRPSRSGRASVPRSTRQQAPVAAGRSAIGDQPRRAT